MKKRLSLLLALVMVIAMATGVTGASAEVAKKDVTIQVICPSNVQEFPEGTTANSNIIVDYWREKTGYEFDVTVLTSEGESEKLNVMFNSGELNGVVFRRGAASVGQLASQGLLAQLDEYMATTNFFEKFDYCQSVGTYDGHQYAAIIPSDGIGYSTQNGMWFVNKGAMAEMGYTELPATFEEFDAFLYAAKDAGYMPLAAYGTPASYDAFAFLQGLFGISGGQSGIRDGAVVNKLLQPEAKEYLTYVKKLYDDGIIPSDFASQTQDGVIELLLSGKALTATSISVWNGKQVMTQGEELGMDLRYADYPTTVDGEKAYGGINLGYGGITQSVLVSSSCTYVQDVMNFLDFLIEPETIMMNNYGIEGEHYNMVDGVPVVTDRSSEVAFAVYYRNVFLPEDWYTVYGTGAGWAEYYYPAERNSVGNPDYDPIIHLPVDSELVAKYDELYTNMIAPYFTKVVTGEASLDDFDSIVEQWKSNGGQAVLDHYTEVWKGLGEPASEYMTFLPAEHAAYTGKYLFHGEADLATQVVMDAE